MCETMLYFSMIVIFLTSFYHFDYSLIINIIFDHPFENISKEVNPVNCINGTSIRWSRKTKISLCLTIRLPKTRTTLGHVFLQQTKEKSNPSTVIHIDDVMYISHNHLEHGKLHVSAI
jgi:hypothetical protein